MDPDRTAAAHAVLASSRALVALTARSLEQAPAEVTLSQWRALVLVQTRGAQRQVDVAADLGLSASSTSRLVERLERKGLLTRRPSASSRREVELALTAEGVALVDHVLGRRLDDIDAILATVPADRWGTIEEAFRMFAVAAGEPLDHGGPVTPAG